MRLPVSSQARLKRGNRILFSPQDECLLPLSHRLAEADRRTITLWALSFAEEIAHSLASCGDGPFRAVFAARAWAAGEITMPSARREILACHALARECGNAADAALCHAVGQGCSVVHTVRHAMGLPVYELTALALRFGAEEGGTAIAARTEEYVARLNKFASRDRAGEKWAKFIV